MTLPRKTPLAELGLLPETVAALERAHIKTLGQLALATRPGIGARPQLRPLLPEIDEAFARHGLAFDEPAGVMNICKSCPSCPECGAPLALDSRNVVADLDGTYRHVGWRARRGNGTCATCHDHHAGLLDEVAA